MREHLNKSLGEEGLERDFRLSKSKSFLSHPIPECSCRILETTKIHRLSYEGDVECPKWMEEGFKTVGFQKIRANESDSEDEEDLEEQLQSDDEGNTSSTTTLSEQDEEMDPDD